MASGWPGKGHGTLLKKSLSARSAVQKRPEPRPKYYFNTLGNPYSITYAERPAEHCPPRA